MTQVKSFHSDEPDETWIEILNPDIKLGHVRHALIDFDGTISVIRQGWEDVMIPLMIEEICEGMPPKPDIVDEVRRYVDYSTGILTIEQMRWLEEAVRRYGISKHPKTAFEYKRIYNERLLKKVEKRLEKLENGELSPDSMMIAGSLGFLKGLYERGVIMYLVSGTDHEYVINEARDLRIADFFRGGIYGALDHTEANTKERIIQRTLDGYNLKGNELLVVGDGPVEIRNAKARNATALGVASDEVKREGLNPRKRRRLINAGADFIIADFKEHNRLFHFLFDEKDYS